MISTAGAERRSIWIDLLLYPTHTLPTAAAPVLVGMGLAIHRGTFAALPVALAFLASWCIHVAGVFMDNLRLVAEHPDVPEHPELLAALADGTLTLSGLSWAIATCFVIAAIAGSYLIAIAGVAAAILGVIGTIASLGYSVSPLALVKLGIADPVFLLMFGVVAVAGTYYVQAAAVARVPFGWHIVSGALPFEAFIVGLPVGAIITCVLLIDDIRDRAFDARKGWHTPPVRFGLRWTRCEFVVLMTAAYALPLWFCFGLGFGWGVLLPLVTLPVACAVTRTICRTTDFAALFPLTPKSSMLALGYALLLGAGLALAV
jgi:1,4-dihydroxy-2-naphthoate octaprenyltransferase